MANPEPKLSVTRRIIFLVCAETGLDPRTVKATLEGTKRPHRYIHRAIAESARNYGLSIPDREARP